MPAPTRRVVLQALCGSATLVLAGCSADRRPAPGPDPDPTGSRADPTRTARTEIADEATLLAALERARALSSNADAISGASGRTAAVLDRARPALAEQVEVLEQLLSAGGVPLPATPDVADTDRSTATGGPDSDTSTRSSSPDKDTTQAAKRQLERIGAMAAQDVSQDALSVLSEVSTANLPVLISLAGHHGALAILADVEIDWAPMRAPDGEAAAALLTVLRPAVYGLEVITARTPQEDRQRYADPLRQLRRIGRQLTELAGEAAPPAPLGYTLPRPVDTRRERARLAGDIVTSLPEAVLAGSGELTGDRAAVAGTVRMLAEVVSLEQPFAVEPTGFPGLVLP